jgi:hypothetical protein
MKVKAKFYKGIEFISVHELPADQQMLLQHAQHPERIKILLGGKILSNCIQYNAYSDWYATVFKRSVAARKNTTTREEVFPIKIAMGKA